MKNRYDEVMEHVEVNDEMRDRILANINSLTFEKASVKATSFPNYRKYLSIAACLVLLIVSSVFIRNAVEMPSDPPIQVVPDIVTVQSVEDLSDAVGFTVKEIHDLPFEIKSVTYTSYWGEVADIEYAGSVNAAIFRMAVGNEDVSGYFDEFTSVESHAINGYEVTIKGNDGQYLLALWQKDGYSYSVQFREPVSEQEMLGTLQSVQ